MIDSKEKAFAWSCFLSGCQSVWKRYQMAQGGTRDIPADETRAWRRQFDDEWDVEQEVRFALANAVWAFHKAQTEYTENPLDRRRVFYYFDARSDMISIDVNRYCMYRIPRAAEEEDPFPHRGHMEWL